MHKLQFLYTNLNKIIRDTFGLLGCYYLIDAGHTNGKGFLASYRGTIYYLSEQRDVYAPINHEEYFNMKHASARNIIKCCFGIIKMRWVILRSPCFYLIKTQNRVIMACCLIHNLIRREMSINQDENAYDLSPNSENVVEDEVIGSIASSSQWTTWRDDLAKQMFDEWRGNRG